MMIRFMKRVILWMKKWAMRMQQQWWRERLLLKMRMQQQQQVHLPSKKKTRKLTPKLEELRNSPIKSRAVAA